MTQEQIAMITDEEKKLLIQFENFILSNKDREITQITIKFQHKRFPDNTGFASLKIPRSSGKWAFYLLRESILKFINNTTK